MGYLSSPRICMESTQTRVKLSKLSYERKRVTDKAEVGQKEQGHLGMCFFLESTRRRRIREARIQWIWFKYKMELFSKQDRYIYTFMLKISRLSEVTSTRLSLYGSCTCFGLWSNSLASWLWLAARILFLHVLKQLLIHIVLAGFRLLNTWLEAN